MRSFLAGIRQLVLPWGAGVGQSRIVLGPDIPPELQAAYIGTDTLTAAILAYGNAVNDDRYWYLGIAANASGTMYCGWVVDQSNVLETWRQSFGMVPNPRTFLWFARKDNSPKSDFHMGQESGLAGGNELWLHSDTTLQLTSTSRIRLSNHAQTLNPSFVHLITDKGEAEASANLALNLVATLVPSCSVILDPARVDPEFEVEICCCFQINVAGNARCLGELYIDGVQWGAKAAVYESQTANDVGTPSQIYSGQLSGNGPFTFELRARRNVAAGTQFALATHTSIRAKLLEGTT